MKVGNTMNIKVIDVRCKKADAAFLIDDGKTSILYDTGFGFTGQAISKNIKSYLKDRPLDYIFLTHSHYDHVLGCPYILRDYPNAKVVAGTYAVDIFKRDGAKKVMKELDSKFAETCGITDYEFPGDELKVDIAVNDGDLVRAGDMEFQVINLPGHTRCSIGFYCEKEKFFLSCESLGVFDGNKTILPLFLVSYHDTISSIEKIENLNITSFLAAHCGVLDEQQTQFFLKNAKISMQSTAQEILTGLKQGMTDDEIVQQFKDKFWQGYIREIYPEDAINLNTSLIVKTVKKELLF